MIAACFEPLYARLSVIAACLVRSRSHAFYVAFESLDPACAAMFRDALKRDESLATPRGELLARVGAAVAERDHAIAERDRIVAERDNAIAAMERTVSEGMTEATALRGKVAKLEASNGILRVYTTARR